MKFLSQSVRRMPRMDLLHKVQNIKNLYYATAVALQTGRPLKMLSTIVDMSNTVISDWKIRKITKIEGPSSLLLQASAMSYNFPAMFGNI